MGAKLRRWHDSILDTFKELEGADTDDETYALPQPASGLITVDFSVGTAASDWTAAERTEHDDRRNATRTSYDDSVISLKPKQTPESQV